MDLIRWVHSLRLLSVSQNKELLSYLVNEDRPLTKGGRAVETAALMETVEKTVKGRDFSLNVFSTSFHSAWKTRRSIRRSSVGKRRRVFHSSHSPYCYYHHLSNTKQRETDRQLVSANLVLYG